MLLCLEQGNRTNSKEINTARGKDGEMVRQRGKDYGKRLWGRETKNKGKRGRGAERERERERSSHHYAVIKHPYGVNVEPV